MFQSLIRVTDRRCAEKPHPPVWHLSVRCFRTCSLSACLLSSSRRSCSISSYLLLCSRSCCFLSSRSRRCCCRWKPFYTTTPQLSACPCVSVCARQACFPGIWMSWGANKQVWCFTCRKSDFIIILICFSQIQTAEGQIDFLCVT